MKKAAFLSIGLISILILFTIFSTESGIKIKEQTQNENLPDFAQIAEEAANDLQKYIRIKTIRGNEIESANFLKEILEKNGIETKFISYPGKPDRTSLIAELPGIEDGGGIIFMNHMDIVEAEAAEWKYPPFNGVRIEDKIYGRGAVDMKGLKHSEPATISPMDSKFFKTIAATAIKVVPGAVVTPFLSPGTTDSSYFRMNGFKCYGLIPALLTDMELDGIHGKNESIRVIHLKTGIQILFETILNYNK